MVSSILKFIGLLAVMHLLWALVPYGRAVDIGIVFAGLWMLATKK